MRLKEGHPRFLKEGDGEGRKETLKAQYSEDEEEAVGVIGDKGISQDGVGAVAGAYVSFAPYLCRKSLAYFS